MSRLPSRFTRQFCAPHSDKARARKPRLTLQSLEDRAVPATIPVTSIADTGPGTLRAAITQANTLASDDEITFDSTLFSTPQIISLSTALPTFSATAGALTITGPGEDLVNIERASGAGTDFRVFSSLTPTLDLSGMTISGGTDYSAGLLTEGTTTIDHVVFTGATSIGNAGGLSIYANQTATISNSIITNNTATFSGGGAGGILVGTGGKLTLIDSQVTNNSAPNGISGGILVNPNGTLILQGSTISGNQAGTLGGGILANSYCYISITDSIISNNTAGGTTGTGGGIFLNPHNTLKVQGSTISGNHSGSFGGGILANKYCDISITDSEISNNTSVGAGGGIFENGNGTITIVGSTFSQNVTTPSSQPSEGGAIYSNTASTISIEDSNISGNTADLGGGLFFFKGASLSIANSTVSGNTAFAGGGLLTVYLTGSTLIDGSTISGNMSTSGTYYGGGGAYLVGAPTLLSSPTVIRNSTIANNTSATNGGGLMMINQFSNLSIESSTITGNSASATGANSFGYPFGGGGINVIFGSGTVTLTNSVVAENLNPGGAPDLAASPPVTLKNSAIGNMTGFTAIGTSIIPAGTDLKLGTLGDYGGPTQTVPILPDSPLRDSGDNTLLGGITTDQRGFARPSSLNPKTDIGAYEIQPLTVTIDQSATTNDPSNALSPITFDVHFSEPVMGFDGTGIDFTGSSLSLGTLTATVTPIGTSQSDYTVTVTGMTPGSTGNIVVNIDAGVATDLAEFPNSASTSTDNIVAFDDVAPTVTIDKSVAQPDPTNIGPISFDVVFSEPVVGFGPGSIDLSGSTGVGTPTVLSVTPTGPSSYTVVVTGMNGTGNVVANIDAGVVTDPAGNSNTVSTSTDNTVAFDNVAPTVTINQGATQVDPTGDLPITFDVVFSEPVTGFTSGAVDLSASTVGGTPTATVTQLTPTTYTVTVDGATTRGDVIATISAGVVTDLAGNLNTASTSTDNSVAFVHAGTISFTTSTVATAEGATITVTATRTGGSDGIVSVDYTTTPGTAHTPSDYIAAAGSTLAGTLTWGDGDTTDQTFQIQIVDDSANEGKEIFTVGMSNPIGGVVLGATTTETIAIAPSDGQVINAAAVKPAKPQFVFTDGDGDLVTVKLAGKLGSATVFITDPDGDGHGPLELIQLAGTDPIKSVLTITSAKAKHGTGDGRVALAEVTGTDLKALTATKTDLNGPGITMSGFLNTVSLGSIGGGADITVAGTAPAGSKGAKAGLTITSAGTIGDGTDITLAQVPLVSLKAISVGTGGTISAPYAGRITTTANKKLADPGNFGSNITLSGIGVPAKTPALKSLSVKGAADGITIKVASGTGTVGDIGTMSFGSFTNSQVFAGYAGPTDGSGSFNLGSTIGSFKVIGKTTAFAHSFVIGTNFKSTTLASADTANGGTKFGFVYHGTFGALGVTALKLKYNTKLGGTQVISGDLEVLKV